MSTHSAHIRLTIKNTDIPPEIVETGRSRLTAFAKMLEHRVERKIGPYEIPEDALRLPVDAHLLEDVRHVAERFVSTRLKYVVVVGIGGSNLGTEAVYNATLGARTYLTEHIPKLLVLDTLSASAHNAVVERLTICADLEEFVIVIVSKSGTTTETIANASCLLEKLTEHFGSVTKRVVVISDTHSPLDRWAEDEGIYSLAIPEKVGGRWSALSAVGLLPLLLTGVNIPDLRKGAAHLLPTVTSTDVAENPALRLAFALLAALARGAHILDLFIFDPDGEALGKWTRQLFAESLGKEMTRKGNAVGGTLTPTVAIGSTDLHSVAQLNLAGMKDKVTLFIRSGTHGMMVIPKNDPLAALVPGLAGKDAAEIMRAISGGTQAAYTKRALPHMDLEFPSGFTAEAIGEYMTLMMATVMYMAELLDVNAFDQPAVEEYKSETRRILETRI